ncbi:hypothetical protein [uncultured Desulfobacter sp.]|nr:hypothetical protein [uncultured Desulfobacter sp.]
MGGRKQAKKLASIDEREDNTPERFRGLSRGRTVYLCVLLTAGY